jgi:hypothetical protein
VCHIQNPACSVGDSRDHLIGRIDHRTVITLTPAPAAHQIGRHRLPSDQYAVSADRIAFCPLPAKVGLQDIELAEIGQRMSEPS